MRIDILTALPELIASPLQHSILKRAQDKNLAVINVHDLRDYTTDKHKQLDDYPFGGGGGMVMKPEPIFACIETLHAQAKQRGGNYDEVIYLSPDGETFNQSLANTLSLKKNLILLAGHYKGVDQRVRDVLITREISVGDYVLSGGELPALILVDALVRLIPGVLGDAASALSDAFQDDLLGTPVYTRPALFRGMEVPAVLRSGDHNKIATWREEQRETKTKTLRPDLLDKDRFIDINNTEDAHV